MMYGLPAHNIAAITSELARHAEVQCAVLYGSRAMGNYRTGSDIDLCLKGKDLDLTALQRIETQLDDLELPYKIDLSLYHHIDNASLLEHIDRVGIVFYESESNGEVEKTIGPNA